MPSLDGAVGKGGQNKGHDVAVVQAALGKVKGPDRRPLWPGPIDGDYQRHRGSLDVAIGRFQQSHRLRPTGKLNRAGGDVARMESALPASHRKMSGAPGTAVVRRQTSNAQARTPTSATGERWFTLP